MQIIWILQVCKIKVCVLLIDSTKSPWTMFLIKYLGFVHLVFWKWLYLSYIKLKSGVTVFEALSEVSLYFYTKSHNLYILYPLWPIHFSVIFKSIHKRNIKGKYFRSSMALYKVINFLFRVWTKLLFQFLCWALILLFFFLTCLTRECKRKNWKSFYFDAISFKLPK